MAALLRKELRVLGPWLGLVVLLWGGDWFVESLSGWPDATPLWDSLDLVANEPGDRQPQTFLLFVLALSAALALVPGEIDRGRLEFLDGLPVSRTQIFWSKAFAAGLMLALAPLVGVLEAVSFHALSRESLDRSFHAGLLATALALHVAQGLVLLSFGLVLSYLRRFAWAAAGLLYMALDLAIERWPALRLLDVAALTDPAFDGQTWLVPWPMLGVQALLGLASLVAAWGLFTRVRIHDRPASLTRRRGCLHSILAAVAVTSALAVFGWLFGRVAHRESASEAAAPGPPLARSHTRHYTFAFPAALGERAGVLAAEADDLYDAVARLLGAEPIGRLSVDATGIRDSAAASGLARGRALQVDLVDLGPTASRRVLAHETAHAFANVLSEDRLDARLLSEGLATWAELRVAPNPRRLDGLRLRAAVLHARREADFDMLLDEDEVERRYDPDVVYPLGHAFFEGLVSACGDGVVGGFLRALGSPDHVEDLQGREAWEDALRRAGCDLERAIGAYAEGLERAAGQAREYIRSMPRLRGRLVERQQQVGVRIESDTPLPANVALACRFRVASTAREDLLHSAPESDRTCWQSRSSFVAGTVHYQLGFADDRLGAVLWQRWTEVPLGR